MLAQTGQHAKVISAHRITSEDWRKRKLLQQATAVGVGVMDGHNAAIETVLREKR
ncbi:MAG TPA: hypothetical protein VGE80_16595 [Schlesneria sp.]